MRRGAGQRGQRIQVGALRVHGAGEIGLGDLAELLVDESVLLHGGAPGAGVRSGQCRQPRRAARFVIGEMGYRREYRRHGPQANRNSRAGVSTSTCRRSPASGSSLSTNAQALP